MKRRTTISTQDGPFEAVFTDKGLAELSFPTGSQHPHDRSEIPAAWTREVADALCAALRGRQPKRLPPLDLSRGTAFQQKVWNALLAIPAGETKSYSELAQSIGAPGAARAVGGACGANPIPVLVPCHRVLAANKRLGGFSAGLHWKRLLLDRESVNFTD